MRLPDQDLTVLVDRAAEGAVNTWSSGPGWNELEKAAQNEIREDGGGR